MCRRLEERGADGDQQGHIARERGQCGCHFRWRGPPGPSSRDSPQIPQRGGLSLETIPFQSVRAAPVPSICGLSSIGILLSHLRGRPQPKVCGSQFGAAGVQRRPCCACAPPTPAGSSARPPRSALLFRLTSWCTHYSYSPGRFCSLPQLCLGVLSPPCDIPSGCCFFTGPWTVTRSSLCMLRRVAAFCRPLRPVLLVSAFAEPSSWCAGAVLDVAWCAVCASAAPSSWRIEVVLVVAGVV